MKKLIVFTLVILVLMFNVTSFGASEVVNLSNGVNFTSTDYQKMAKTLANSYPEILRYEEIGVTADKNVLFTLILTKDVKALYGKPEFNVERKHYLMESGTHARETLNPAILLKMVESYAIDYYNDKHIPGYNLSEMLKTNAIHFVPLLNPDGHDLAKFGISSVNNQTTLDVLSKMKDKNYKNWKSNAKGVDINRNFPDIYVDSKTGEWVNKWKLYPTEFETEVPGGSYYHGTAGSELETKALMNYMDKYNFRSYISYHSKGEVLYSSFYWHPKEFNASVTEYAKMISKVTGYGFGSSSKDGSGYSTEYFASITLKPTLTVETQPSSLSLPSPQSQYTAVYTKVKTLPLETIKMFQDKAYGKYKLYNSKGEYLKDFDNSLYAYANAKRILGSVSEYVGAPKTFLGKEITREEALIKILGNRFNLAKLTVDATDRFTDTNSVFTTFAKNIKIVNGDKDGKFYPNRSVTPSEYATIYYNTDLYLGLVVDETYRNLEIKFTHPSWAENAIKYSLTTGFLNEEQFSFSKVFEMKK